MRPHNVISPSRRRLTVALVALVALVVVVCGVGLVPGTAQSPRREEREMLDTIPKHVPIKVKVKNPKKVSDLKNEDWLVDLEVEVTNTGTKPIYRLGLSLYLPETEDPNDGSVVGYPLQYGRIQLVDLNEPIRPDDVPLRPGESCVLKVPELSAKWWRHWRVKDNLPSPKKLKLELTGLFFGDGTGLVGPDGELLPKKDRSSTAPCRDDEAGQA